MYVCKLNSKDIAEKFELKSNNEIIQMLKNLLIKSINGNNKLVE